MLDQVIDPFGTPAVWWVIFGGVLVGCAGVVVAALRYWRREPAAQAAAPEPVRTRRVSGAVARIDAVVARHAADTPEDVRALHLELAAELRAIMGELVGKDLSAWQVAQLREVAAFSAAADAIEEWEEPSFSAEPHASAQAARDRAVRAVSW
ncbi:hypothetical protein HMPREF3167_07430 [Trueperella sp. HMSC08B05]|uniref:Uncharacterized protein n=1 Tax=Trueperella bernardiae TaxID=59561 RepID=A0A0W1KHL3_9ACTO|nr:MULTISPECIES: hypothetical protein [Trueperella]KTF03521.1 hypothetical protein AQZ59_01651 [Trueperella bernardiae]MDK8601996.1 hypothetical protein [Trueperella bernardiae]MDV6239133.1 hypothetical protein [Trueperella bernardiae]OCW60191.1 hypothetical protein AKG36_05405 [Trueperella bernardiae]OFS66921.1 hypothetical protein HMPREF3174_05320 [Trueperella sp. HMSC08H06]